MDAAAADAAHASRGDVKWAWEHRDAKGVGLNMIAIAVSPCDGRLACGGEDCAVTIYDLVSGARVYVFPTATVVNSVSLAQVAWR